MLIEEYQPQSAQDIQEARCGADLRPGKEIVNNSEKIDWNADACRMYPHFLCFSAKVLIFCVLF